MTKHEVFIDRVLRGELVDLSKCFHPGEGTYARPVTEQGLARLRKTWQARWQKTLILSLRDDGTYAIVDGNHTVAIAKENGIKAMHADVYIDLTYEEEAKLFAVRNTPVAKMHPIDIFRASLEAKEPEALHISEILAAFQLKIANSPAPSHVRSVVELRDIYRMHGPDVFEDVIETLYEGFGVVENAFGVGSLGGMTRFLIRYAKTMDRDRLLKIMRKTGPHRMSQYADAIRVAASSKMDVGQAWGRAFLREYNRGMRLNPLPEWVVNVLSQEGLKGARQRVMKGYETRKARGENISETIRKANEVRKANGYSSASEGARKGHITRKQRAEAAARKNSEL